MLYHFFSEEMSSFALLFHCWEARQNHNLNHAAMSLGTFGITLLLAIFVIHCWELRLKPLLWLNTRCAATYWASTDLVQVQISVLGSKNVLFKSLWIGSASPGCCLRLLAHAALLGCGCSQPAQPDQAHAPLKHQPSANSSLPPSLGAARVFCPRSRHSTAAAATWQLGGIGTLHAPPEGGLWFVFLDVRIWGVWGVPKYLGFLFLIITFIISQTVPYICLKHFCSLL